MKKAGTRRSASPPPCAVRPFLLRPGLRLERGAVGGLVEALDAGDALRDRGLRHGRRDERAQAAVEGLREDVVRPEGEVLARVERGGGLVGRDARGGGEGVGRGELNM